MINENPDPLAQQFLPVIFPSLFFRYEKRRDEAKERTMWKKEKKIEEKKNVLCTSIIFGPLHNQNTTEKVHLSIPISIVERIPYKDE